MSASRLGESFMASRPRLGHRSVSDISPLVEPHNRASTSNQLPGLPGSRARAQNLISGAELKLGGRAPITPLLPMPPAKSQAEMGDMDAFLRANQGSGNSTPKATTSQRSNTLALRRQAKRGASEGICPTCMDTLHHCAMFGPSCGSRKSLHVDTKSAAGQQGLMQPPQPRSAGMIRSYSLPVATQQEYEEQHRIMALGVSPVGAYTANPSWWSYGFASPGGAPLNFSRRGSTGPAPHERVLAPQRPSQQGSRQKLSPSSSPRSKGLNGSPRNLQRSPKNTRSPLGSMSLNLAPSEQRASRHLGTSSPLAIKHGSPMQLSTMRSGSIDRAIDGLSARLDRCTAADAATEDDMAANADVLMEEDYFSQRKGSASTSDAGSDEALTPRAASPETSPFTRSGSLGLDFGAEAGTQSKPRYGSPLGQTYTTDGDDLEGLDFIHPDHLQPLPPIDF
ncbi:hypothetical protein ACQY0O_007957 [Thecaphora frezii]